MAGIANRVYVAALGILVVALVAITGRSIAAQTAEQDIVRVEQARIQARQKGDSAALTRLLADDYTHITPAGQVQQKKYAVSLSAAPKIGVRDLRTRVFGDVAVVTGVQSGTGPEPNATDARFTHVWQKRNGQWVALFVQNTRIVSPQPATTPGTTLKVPPTEWPKGLSQGEQQVVDTHRRIDEAFAKKDVAAYSALTAANWVRLNSDGSETAREAFLKDVAGTPEQKRVFPSHSEFHLRIYGPIAVLTYLAKPVAGPELGIRRSRVFVKEGGTWKQLVSQETLVTQS